MLFNLRVHLLLSGVLRIHTLDRYYEDLHICNAAVEEFSS